MPRSPDAAWEGTDGFPLTDPETSGDNHRGTDCVLVVAQLCERSIGLIMADMANHLHTSWARYRRFDSGIAPSAAR